VSRFSCFLCVTGDLLPCGFQLELMRSIILSRVQYFSCPPSCGVFVASSKLSFPPVRTSMTSRPSSVASSRSGRTTPSVSGWMTPSISNGRVTPSVSLGRITPSLSNSRVTPSLPSGRTTPATRARSLGYPRLGVATPKTTNTTENKITPGSRASKYVGITANQLSARKHTTTPSFRKSMGGESPTRKSFASASPAKTMGSPFNTPKLGPSIQLGDGSPSPTKGRMSFKTPKPRVPSAVAMPPPSSPSMALSSLTISLNDEMPELIHPTSRTVAVSSSPRPGSTSSSRSTPVRELLDDMSRLQSRLDALEFENHQLREAQSKPPVEQVDNSAELISLRTERSEFQSRINTLETTLKSHERSLDERDTKIQALERSIKDSALDISKLKSDNENRMRDLQAKLDDSEALNRNLKEVLEAKEGQENANDAVLAAKSAEISVLEGRIEKVYKDLEDERRELGAQVGELRKAGQVIASFYYEGVNSADDIE
jgi:CAP-Gly domain-containing linker protein 1